MALTNTAGLGITTQSRQPLPGADKVNKNELKTLNLQRMVRLAQPRHHHVPLHDQ